MSLSALSADLLAVVSPVSYGDRTMVINSCSYNVNTYNALFTITVVMSALSPSSICCPFSLQVWVLHVNSATSTAFIGEIGAATHATAQTELMHAIQ